MKVSVFDTNTSKVAVTELDDSVFGAEVRPHLFWEVVKMQQANRRRGTHSTKTVSEVRGSGARPYRQKGTGRARHGSKRAMNMRGGGIVFGPRPRDHGYKIPKKMVKCALRSALSLRLAEEKLTIIKGWAPKAPKTKEALQVLKGFSVERALVVGSKENVELQRSLRNLAWVKFLPLEGLNVYDILRYDNLILSAEVVAEINEKYRTLPSRREQALQEARAGGADAS